MKRQETSELEQIPGVGKAIALDFRNLGIHSVLDLKRQNPDQLYYNLCFYQGKQVDRCMLYVFRCTVYYASTDKHEPELLKWWNWKDKEGISKGS